MLWTLFVRCPQPPDLITEVFHESGGNQRWNVGADDERASERDGSNIGKRQTRKAVASEHLVTEQNAHFVRGEASPSLKLHDCPLAMIRTIEKACHSVTLSSSSESW